MVQRAKSNMLPEGLSDLLDPHAAAEAKLVELLSYSFYLNGYDRVSPPVLEFEDTLLAGIGAATSNRIFRIVDPSSQRVLGIRADVTAQIARIASSGLKTINRPLRLMYAGQVFRVQGHSLRPERQFTQVGCELIGPDTIAADAEALIVAIQALLDVGLLDITIDLSMAPLVTCLLTECGITSLNENSSLYLALNQKDIAKIQSLLGEKGDVFIDLVNASGPLDYAQKKMNCIDLPDKAKSHVERLFSVGSIIKSEFPQCSVSADFVENRGLNYHSGLTFCIISSITKHEVGRGGRYMIKHAGEELEPATGLTLFMDKVLPEFSYSESLPSICVPLATKQIKISELKNKGYRVRRALSVNKDLLTEAILLDCSYILSNNDEIRVNKSES